MKAAIKKIGLYVVFFLNNFTKQNQSREMLKIFFILNILTLQEEVEIQTASGANLCMLESVPKFSRNVKLLEHSKKYSKPIVLKIEQDVVLQVLRCEQATVNQIFDEEDGAFKISFFPLAGIYKISKDNLELLDRLKTSQRDKKPVWLGIDMNKIVLVESVENE